MSLRAEVAEVSRKTVDSWDHRVHVVLWIAGRNGTAKVVHETSERLTIEPDVEVAADNGVEQLAQLAERLRSSLRALGIDLRDRPETGD